jgi:HK97 family phage portal protein
MLTRAAVPKAGLGNLLVGPPNAGSGGKGPKVATANVSWNSPGQPQILDQDTQAFGEESYLGQTYVMRCCQAISHTIAGLPFRAGMDPTDPAAHDLSAPLVQLLGESTPQAPGGPNPDTSSRAFWAWSIIQYLVYGRYAWEAQLTGPRNNQLVVGLWALPVNCVSAIPTQSGEHYFDSFVYTTPMWGDLKLTREQMIYAWRPSLADWRVPESNLSAAKMPVYIARGLDKYMVKLLQNDMVASTLVVTPPFEEQSARRAWQEQFLTSFSGMDNKGKTIFAEAEYDEDDSSGRPLVQVEKIAQTAVDAQLQEIAKTAKDEICVAMGVPLSLIGNAQERIYANAASEYKNFWTMTVMNIIEEIQDHVNNNLAPRLGEEVGWFDLSRVAALQPPQIFAPPMIGDVINYGIASAAQIANVLGIPAADATSDSDVDTVELGEESTGIGPSGINRAANNAYTRARVNSQMVSRIDAQRLRNQHRFQTRADEAIQAWSGTRVHKQQLINARIRYEQRPINTRNWNEPFIAALWLKQQRLSPEWTSPELQRTEIETKALQDLAEATAEPVELESVEAKHILSEVQHIQERRAARELERRKRDTEEQVNRTIGLAEGVRFLTNQQRLTGQIYHSLTEHYPEEALQWVPEADWTGPQQVSLSDIDMSRRPGGRDPKRTAGVMKAMVTGDPGALKPIVLVNSPESDKLKVADGYHRLKAKEKLGHGSISAYVGRVSEEQGPWLSEMHAKKLNRSADVETDTFMEGQRDRIARFEQKSAQEYADTHPEALEGDYESYAAGYQAEPGDVEHIVEETQTPTDTREVYDDVAKTNRSSYYEGVSDQRGGRPKKSHDDFVKLHPSTDSDDYTYYEKGYEDAKQPGRRAWLPNNDLGVGPCYKCGAPSTGVQVTDGSSYGVCGVHADVADSGTVNALRELDPTIEPFSGTDFEGWIERNSEGLLALAEAELEKEDA